VFSYVECCAALNVCLSPSRHDEAHRRVTDVTPPVAVAWHVGLNVASIKFNIAIGRGRESNSCDLSVGKRAELQLLPNQQSVAQGRCYLVRVLGTSWREHCGR
jgi:hypothetical protein